MIRFYHPTFSDYKRAVKTSGSLVNLTACPGENPGGPALKSGIATRPDPVARITQDERSQAGEGQRLGPPSGRAMEVSEQGKPPLRVTQVSQIVLKLA
jgi:hypothetical protein